MWIPRDTMMLLDALRGAYAQAGTSLSATGRSAAAALSRWRAVAQRGPSAELWQVGPAMGSIIDASLLRRLDATRLSRADQAALAAALGGRWLAMRSADRQRVYMSINAAVDRGEFR